MQSQDTIAEPSTAASPGLWNGHVALRQAQGDMAFRQSSTGLEQPDPVGTPDPLEAQPDTLDIRPVSFPFWMVKAIALDLEEKQRLEQELRLYSREMATYRKLVESMEKKEQERQLQLILLGKNINLLEKQLQAQKVTGKGAGTLIWSLRLLAALGAGFVLGRLR